MAELEDIISFISLEPIILPDPETLRREEEMRKAKIKKLLDNYLIGERDKKKRERSIELTL